MRYLALIRNLAGWLGAVGGTLLALSGAQALVREVVSVPSHFFKITAVLGMILGAASVFLLVTLAIIRIFPSRTLVTYRLSPAQRGDLSKIHSFSRKFVGNYHAGLDRWMVRYDMNPNTFFVVKTTRRRIYATVERIVGVFTIIPVTETARKLLDEDRLNATLFTDEHVAPPNQKCAAIYVSLIVGSSHFAKGLTLSFLIDRIKLLFLSYGNVPIFTRPMTDDGLRLAKAYGFTPVTPSAEDTPDHIYRRTFQGTEAISSAIRSVSGDTPTNTDHIVPHFREVESLENLQPPTRIL